MKKVFVMILALACLLMLCACGNKEEEPTQPQLTLGAEVTQATKGTEAPTEAIVEAPSEQPSEAAKPEVKALNLVFTYEGVTLKPGDAFDPSVLPETDNVYKVPSCALEGTDNVYGYDAFEVTAFDEGNGEFIYSIYFVDPNLTTPEGLALGDGLEDVTALYGENYTQNGTEYVYSDGSVNLILLLEGDVVVSIEYRLIMAD